MSKLPAQTLLTETDLVEDTKSRLLLVAAEIFAEFGFDKTSVREISRRANTNIAAINYHFGDKAGLYREIFRQPIPWVDSPFDVDEEGRLLSCEAALLKFFQQLTRPLHNNDGVCKMMRLYAQEQIQPTGILAERAKVIEPHHERLCLFIARELGMQDSHSVQIKRLAIVLVGLAKHFWISRDLIDILAPEVLKNTTTLNELPCILAQYALALIQTEKKRLTDVPNATLTTGDHLT